MSEIPLQSRPVPQRQHWTVPVAREETLAVREKFRKVGWRPPFHKPSTSKVVARAKSLWDRYVTTSSILTHLGYKSLMGVVRHCEHIGVDPDRHLLESGPSDFETWIDWVIRTTKKKTHETISQQWKWLCQAYSVLARQPMDAFTTQQVRRVRLPNLTTGNI